MGNQVLHYRTSARGKRFVAGHKTDKYNLIVDYVKPYELKNLSLGQLKREIRKIRKMGEDEGLDGYQIDFKIERNNKPLSEDEEYEIIQAAIE